MSEPSLRPILNTAVVLREQVHAKVTGALQTMFPLDLKGRTLEIKDIQVHAQGFSPDAQRTALLTGNSLHEPVTGTLVLKDANGKVIDEAKKFTLAKIPYFTERHTIILGGNEYQVANQLRRRPGVYTQRSVNGELSSLFNLSKGRNLTMQMTPETGVFHITPVDSSVKLPLYPILRALGMPHADIATHWTPGVANANKDHHGHQEELVMDKLYKKMVHPSLIKPGATHEEKVEAVRAKFDATAMDPGVTGLTLGKEFDKVTPLALLSAGRKLLHVHEGKDEIDDSDSLAFKTFHSVDDFFAERLKLFGRTWKMKVKQRFTGKDKIRDALAPQPFTDTLRKFITSSTLTAVPTGINPLEIIDHAVKVTSLGEGGISEERAIPYDARLVHATHYGILDPVKTPESGAAGIDIRATIGAHRDDHGNLYTTVRNVKTGKTEHLPAGDIMKRTIAFPSQELKGSVDAMINGVVSKVNAKDVTHQYLHNGYAYSPATNLVPLLYNIQGNRAIMGAKHITQALPLLEREAPLVQVMSHDGVNSYEKLITKQIVPTAPVAGTIAKIENGYIYIRPHAEKKSSDDYAAWVAANVRHPKNNCFPYAAAMAVRFPELQLMAGTHTGADPGDTRHFYLRTENGDVVDPTGHQYPTGKLVEGEPVDLAANFGALKEHLAAHPEAAHVFEEKTAAHRDENKITFPAHEHSRLKATLAAGEPITTTRVSLDYHRPWAPGQVYTTSWGARLKVTKVQEHADLSTHPKLDLLTANEKETIQKYGPRFKHLTLEAVDEEKSSALLPAVQAYFDKVANEQGLPAATAWLQQMQDDAKSRGYSIFAVVEDPTHPHGGGSITTVLPGHKGDAVRNARSAHVEWELANGHDPNHDWRKTAKFDNLNIALHASTPRPGYDPPYNVEQLQERGYAHLLDDPTHRWRAETGMELIHKEPSREELERIWKNWQLMSDPQKVMSNAKSQELFGRTNEEHYQHLVENHYKEASAPLTAAAGLGALAGADMLARGGLERVVGAQRFAHGTDDASADAIRSEGLRAALGGTGTSENSDDSRYANAARNRTYVSAGPLGDVSARLFASLAEIKARNHEDLLSPPAVGTVIEGAMPHERFHSQFERDPDTREFGDGVHFRSKTDVSPEDIAQGRPGYGDIIRAHSQDYGNYVAENPGRVATGVAMLAGAGGLGYGAYRAADTLLKSAADKSKKLGPLTFKIDRPKGFVKTWEDSGKSWTYPVDYGYFPKLNGEDGEALDAFVGDDPKGVLMSFLKLKHDDLTGKMEPDETKFLLGVTEKERDTILKFYGDEVSAKTTYDDFDAVSEALKRFIGKRKPRYEKTASECEAAVRTATIKLAEDIGAKHLIITGLPGSGKSTLADQAATLLGRQRIRTDWDPEFRAFIKDRWGQPGYEPEYAAMKRRVVDRALANPEAAVLEGTPFLDFPELAAQHRVVMLDPSAESLRENYLERQRQRAGDTFDENAERTRMESEYSEMSPLADKMRAAPGVNVLKPAWMKAAAWYAKTASHKDDSDLIKVPYLHDFPFPSKTYLHHDVTVKAGDKVEAGQRMSGSNFTHDDTLALGKNLRVAYMAYHGTNSNDAVVISEGCAKKLTSEHMYREVYPVTPRVELNTAKHKTYFGAKRPPNVYEALDADGVVRKGSTVHPHDLLVAGMSPAAPSATDLMLGRISRSLVKPYTDSSLEWHHGFPGEVVEVVKSPSQIAVLVKTREPMQVGDKLSGQHGNKGVVSMIIPDHEMVQDEAKRPVDVIMTSAGIISRINPAQVLTGALGKVAEKIGKPIMVHNDAGYDQTKFVEDLMKKHNVKDKEVLFDPKLGRSIKGPDGKGVFVGRTYIFKLFKSTDVNFAAHGVGPYDINEQPSRPGGEDAPKGFGKMELDALVAHNARNIIKEAGSYRSQKNEEFWKAVQLGHPLPAAKPSFIFNKFVAMLEGAGVKVNKTGSKMKLLPMTDADILGRSKGEILTNKTLIAKNLQPEKGGLFDANLTGGPQGTQYSHIKLHESIPNPVFEGPIRQLLGLSAKAFTSTLQEKGGDHIRKELAKIDVPGDIKTLRKDIPTLKGSDLDGAVKKLKYLEALHTEGLKPQDAYVLKHVPVIPPVFRPIVRQPNNPNQLTVADANKLYIHLFDANTTLKDTVLDSDVGKHREKLYTAVGAVFGTHEPDDDELRGQRVKGFISAIAGVGSPKNGFFQKKLMSRMQDVSGRGTAVPDPNLNMDQVGLPEDMLWKMFDKFLVARLVRNGYPAVQAQDMVTKRTPGAQEALRQEVKERPVMLNRSPTLHRWGIISAYALPVQGKTIRVSPFIEKGLNLDYDGDTLQIHAPITPGGIQDAHKMLLSNQVMADAQRNKLLAYPQHEAILGILHATGMEGKGAVKKFKTHEDMLNAYRKGEIAITDNVEIKK